MRHEAYSGPAHYAWKGDAARETTKRERIQRALSLDGLTCEFDGCGAPAVDRHHIDGDTGNNDLSNIRCLCRRHHMVEDGRLDRLREVALANSRRAAAAPLPPCVICGREITNRRRRKGRCGACSEYLRRNGVERPQKLIDREAAGLRTLQADMSATDPRSIEPAKEAT